MNSWMDEWRKASSFSSTAELSVSQNKLESETYGLSEAKRRQHTRKATANPGELDANLTMLLLLNEEDFLGKKAISTEISLGKC